MNQQVLGGDPHTVPPGDVPPVLRLGPWQDVEVDPADTQDACLNRHVTLRRVVEEDHEVLQTVACDPGLVARDADPATKGQSHTKE